MSRRQDLFALAISALIFASLIGVFFISRFNTQKTPPLTKPDGAISAFDPGMPGDTVFNDPKDFADVEVTVGNVQSVIATLNRPAAYTARVESTLYYGEEKLTTESVCYAHGGLSRVDRTENGVTTTSIFAGKRIYTFMQGHDNYVISSKGGFSADDFSGMASYESLLALPKESITSASLSDRYLVVTTESDSLGYTEIWRISLDSGLLDSLVVTNKDSKVYESKTVVLSLAPLSGDVFTLPDGTKAGE